MRRTTGKYAVPPEVRELRPAGVDCIVKRIKGRFYVYSLKRVDDPARPGRTKKTTDRIIGKIEGGLFVPRGGAVFPGAEPEDVLVTDPAMLDYGAYAVAIAASTWVYEALLKVFTWAVATRVYATALIWAVRGYVPATRISDAFRGSVLYAAWPTLAMSEDSQHELLHKLGRHRVTCARFEQSLIDSGSGTYAIDGHVILCCSAENELADYGHKYRRLGGMQMGLMGVYDVEDDRPLATLSSDGALPDKSSVRDVFEMYRFTDDTLLMDMGFYSEADLALYRQNGCEFVIPVPPNTSIAKAARLDLDYSGRFTYERRDGRETLTVPVLYLERTVAELEEAWQAHVDAAAKERRAAALGAAMALPEGDARDGALAKARRIRSHKVERSAFGGDRVIICRDEEMRRRLGAEFLSNIGSDKRHTVERYMALEPTFGLILLRTNKTCDAAEAYRGYKRRWGIETHYDHVSNGVEFCGLHEQDYYVQQGATFVLTVEGLVHSSVKRAIRASELPKVSGKSVADALERASRAKLTQHADGRWHCSSTTVEVVDVLSSLGVDVRADMKSLGSSTYGPAVEGKGAEGPDWPEAADLASEEPGRSEGQGDLSET